MTPTKIAFEKKYEDGSGVEYGVYYDATNAFRPLTVKGIHEADFDIEELDWLIESLTEVRRQVLGEKA